MAMNPSNFVCTRCGECCKIYAKVTPSDIRRLENAGLKDFTQDDPSGRTADRYLKQQSNGWCTFLRQDKNGFYYCSVYESRPELCKRYPFVKGIKEIEDCRPKNLLEQIKKKIEEKNSASGIASNTV